MATTTYTIHSSNPFFEENKEKIRAATEISVSSTFFVQTSYSYDTDGKEIKFELVKAELDGLVVLTLK